MNTRDGFERLVASPTWKSLSFKQKRSIYYRFVFGMWRDGLYQPVTVHDFFEVAIGAWFSFTKLIETAQRALDWMTDEERAVFIAGLLLGLLCLLKFVG